MSLKILTGLVPSFTTVAILCAMFVPVGAFLIAVSLDKKRRATEKPPQSERLLRPPGYSLAIRLDDVVEKCLRDAGNAIILCVFAEASALSSADILAFKPFACWAWVTGGLFLFLALAGGRLVFRMFRHMQEARYCRLGLRGEQAVAEKLHEVADCGYRAFHDLQGGDDWNIDHVVVGPQGVFAIETKARTKRPSKNNQPSHIVSVDEQTLRFPFGDDAKAIPQAQRNARWLENYLAKKTGEPVQVEPLVVIPGWFVQRTGAGPTTVDVMNATFLAGFLRRQKEKIPAAQVRRIITALDEKCRTIEF